MLVAIDIVKMYVWDMPGHEGAENREWLLMSTGFLFGVKGMFWNQILVVNILNVNEWCILKG